MELELKDIYKYLPFGLNCGLMGEHDEETEQPILFELYSLCSDNVIVLEGKDELNCQYEDLFPILRPMSDLIKPITVDGETFVPIEGLIKIAFSKETEHFEIEKKYGSSSSAIAAEWTFSIKSKYRFVYSFGLFFCYIGNNLNPYGETEIPFYNQELLFDFLYSLHFDVNGLIEKGLAIDINTLK